MTEQFKFLDCYAPMFYEDKTYWLIYGGRGSGKSTNVAAYFVMKLMAPEYFRGVIARFTQKSLTNSIYRDIVDIIVSWNLSSYIEIRNDEIRNKLNRNMIITHAFKIGDNTQTAKGKGISNPTHLLIDEAQEVPGEEEYLKLIDSFRTKGAERKIFIVFNPTTKSSWLFKRWFLPDGSPNPKWAGTHGFIYTTYKNNAHNLDPAKVKEWDLASLTDPEYYHHHILGNWRDIGAGQVFKNWGFGILNIDPEAEVIYGLDFGWTDPTALVKILKKDRTIWVQELVYESGLTPQDLSQRMDVLGIPRHASIYADSSAPMAIEELQRLGWRNLRKANKGPDSISTGISKIHQYQIFADYESKNLLEEYYNYAYREGTEKPIDKHNHCFVGETLIQTKRGKIPIDSVIPGDEVQTRKGFRKVLKVFNNGIKAVKKYEIFDGERYINIKSTEDHLIWQNNNWYPISQLQPGSEIVLLNGLMEKNIDFIKTIPIGQTDLKECTEQSGNFTTDLFLKDMKYTTKTKIKVTIISQIWKFSVQKFIKVCTLKKDFPKILDFLKNFKKQDKKLLPKKCHLGEEAKKVENFTDISELCHTPTSHQVSSSAKNVEKNFVQELFPKSLKQDQNIVSTQNFVISTVVSVHCTKEGEHKVYDLHVEDEHEFFANDLLVHNCMDAIRYAVMELRDGPKYATISRTRPKYEFS